MVEVANSGESIQLTITEQNMKRILFCKDTYFAGEKSIGFFFLRKESMSRRSTQSGGEDSRGSCILLMSFRWDRIKIG